MNADVMKKMLGVGRKESRELEKEKEGEGARKRRESEIINFLPRLWKYFSKKWDLVTV